MNFAAKLTARFGVGCEMVDERLSSYAADRSLSEAGVQSQRREDVLDQVAAQNILETYFSSRNATSGR
jgi:putative Holliday junction resolvase